MALIDRWCGKGCQVRFKELLETWRQNASGARTVTEYPVRLPVDDAARLHALAELFPGRTREQLITDLLGAALQEVAAAMPYVPGKKVISKDEQGDPVYEDAGLTPRFAELTRQVQEEARGRAEEGASRSSGLPASGRRLTARVGDYNPVTLNRGRSHAGLRKARRLLPRPRVRSRARRSLATTCCSTTRRT